MTALVGFFAALVLIAAHLFVLSMLLFLSSLLIGRVLDKLFRWANARRLRVDCGPHKSRGWTP